MVSYVVLSIEFSSFHLHMMDHLIFRTDPLHSIDTLDATHPFAVLSHQATLSILGGSEICRKMNMSQDDTTGTVRFFLWIMVSQQFRLVEKEFKLYRNSKQCKTSIQ
jgi:hypothetical protein